MKLKSMKNNEVHLKADSDADSVPNNDIAPVPDTNTPLDAPVTGIIIPKNLTAAPTKPP